MKFIQAGPTFALAAASLALAGPAGARTVDSWEVDSAGKSCTMVSTFADNVTIGLIWSPQTGELAFMTTVPRPHEWKAQKTVPLVLSFDGKVPLTQWEDQHAAVVASGDSDAVVGNWGREHAADLARTINGSSHVSLRVDDKGIGTYDLTGSPAAYRALIHCGSQIASK